MSQTLSHSQALLARDHAFTGRVASILKDENFSPVGQDPWNQAILYTADVAAQPGIADAYHAAVIAGRDDAATADDVITDGALLAAVTAVMNAPEAG